MLKFYFKYTHFPQENRRDPNLSCFLEIPIFDFEVSDTADKLEIAERGESVIICR